MQHLNHISGRRYITHCHTYTLKEEDELLWITNELAVLDEDGKLVVG